MGAATSPVEMHCGIACYPNSAQVTFYAYFMDSPWAAKDDVLQAHEERPWFYNAFILG